MKLPLNAISIVMLVTITALFGMLLGGVFGWLAGKIAPDDFAHTMAWKELEPRGVPSSSEVSAA